MKCLTLIEANMAPPSGALLGTSGSSQQLSRINSQWANAGVIFGQACDPRATRYNAFINTIIEPMKQVSAIIDNTRNILFNPNYITPITSVDKLCLVPPAVQIPVLTCPEIRKWLQEGRISGWSLAHNSLPDEDIAGRLINNGTVHINHPDPAMQTDGFEWTWKSSDPNYSDEELEMLDASRNFFKEYIKSQLDLDGGLDATNYPNYLPVAGKLKS